MTSVQQIIANAQRDKRKCFPYIARGKLNVICLRDNREIKPFESSNEEFLSNPALAAKTTLDAIVFLSNVVFKVTLDFKETLDCMPTSARECTDWVLLSCSGDRAFYDRNVQRLVLQHCVACVSAPHDTAVPLTVILKFDEDEWTAERVFGQPEQ